MVFTAIHRILAVTLSVLVLISTLTFTVEKHYCGNHLVDTAILSSAKKCGGMDAEDITYTSKPCCKDTVDVVEGQDELTKNEARTFDLETITLFSFVYTFEELFKSLEKPLIPHKNYAPPNIVKDIHVLDETYLI